MTPPRRTPLGELSRNTTAPGPKRKRFEHRQLNTTRQVLVTRVERSYSRRKPEEVVMFLVHCRSHDPSFHPPSKSSQRSIKSNMEVPIPLILPKIL